MELVCCCKDVARSSLKDENGLGLDLLSESFEGGFESGGMSMSTWCDPDADADRDRGLSTTCMFGADRLVKSEKDPSMGTDFEE